MEGDKSGAANPDFTWAGPRLKQVLATVKDSRRKSTDSVLLMHKAAQEDAEEQFKRKDFVAATRSYSLALVAAKKARLLDMHSLLDMMRKYGDCLLLTQSWLDVFNNAVEMIEAKEDFVPAYLQMCQAMLGENNLSFAASCLLKGMVKCSLTNQEKVTFIVQVSKILAKLKMDRIEGNQSDPELLTLMDHRPTLPQISEVWNGILEQLMAEKNFLAVAFLTVGLADGFSTPISFLDGKCPQAVDCSPGNVEDLYSSINPVQRDKWGNRLATFLIDKGVGIGRKTEEPLGIHIAKLCIQHKSTCLLEAVIKKHGIDHLSPESLNSKGESVFHIVAKSQPYTIHFDLVEMLMNFGALPCIKDRSGKFPHEYFTGKFRPHRLCSRMVKSLEQPEDSFKRRVERLKNEGNTAHKNKNSDKAKNYYQTAIDLINKSPYLAKRLSTYVNLRRDLAILYNNMAAVCTSMGNSQGAMDNAAKSIQIDNTYHKPYWRLGKSLVEQKKWKEACEKFVEGLGCQELDPDIKWQFVQEVCTILPSLSDKDSESTVKSMVPMLTDVWPNVVENLSRAKSWDTIKRLVLGPPQKTVDKSAVPAGWRYADSYKEGKQIKVGYAMCLKATTPVLSTLLQCVELHELSTISWVPDLVLALVLQGAPLQSLASADEETCYHAAVFLCCETGKLGLVRYIMSEEPYASQAPAAINREKRSLLHSTCMNTDGDSEAGRQLVRLLLDKGVNPSLIDHVGKKAVEYVKPHSLISELLLNPAGPSPKTAEEMKERGNTEFKKGNYRDAIDYYTQAICKLQNILPPEVLRTKGHEAKKHELAVLYSNRAECHLKLNNIEEAFSDAKESVDFDGHWYRGHVRVARALLRKNNFPQAIKAFSNAFNALGTSATETQKKEVLKELVKTITTQKEQMPRIPHLGYVSSDLWAMVAYDFFCSGNNMVSSDRQVAEFKAAVYAFSLMDLKQMGSGLSLFVDLKPLLVYNNWVIQQNREFAQALLLLILFFIGRGSDHTKLSCYPGDTYLHAVSLLTVFAKDQSLLDYLMPMKVKPNREENLQDDDGNTVLHIFAHSYKSFFPYPIHHEEKLHMLKLLIGWDVNPLIHNKEGKRALDCVDRQVHRDIHDFLERSSKRAPTPYIPHNRPSTSSSSPSPAAKPSPSVTKPPPSVTKPPPSVTKPPPPTAQPAQPTPGSKGMTGGAPNSSQQPSGRNSSHKAEVRQPQCNQCVSMISEAREFFAKDEKSKMAYSKLVNVLGYIHQKDDRHDKFVTEALNLIVEELGKSLTPDVPDVLLKVSQGHLHKILEKLASQNKWRQMEVVVNKAKANDVPRGSFAHNMSVLALVRDKALCGAETQRLQILKLLMQHGAQLRDQQKKDCMIAAIEHGEFRIVEQLVDMGVSPQHISLEKGDTPLHAALTIALDKDKGNNFSLLEKLLTMCEAGPEKFPVLDLAKTDQHNNTLLHLASRSNYSKHSHKAVELLVSKDIPLDVKNSEGKMAIDYLKAHDRRTQYLKVAGKQTSAAVAKKKADNSGQGDTASTTMEEGRLGDGGDNEEKERAELEKTTVDTRGLKTKDAVTLLTGLVHSLSDLTPAEAKLAKISKGKWLEMEKAPEMERESVVYSEDEEEELKTPHVSLKPSPEGDAHSALPQDEEDAEEEEEDVEEEEEEKRQGEDEKEDDPDLLTFDNLEWEVECTAEVWKTLRDPHLTFNLKQRIVRSIKFLASGEWRPQLCRKVRYVPDTINLFQAKFSKGARILWELAIAFSPRLSEDAEKRINEEERKGEFAVCGGRMYTEIIRVWDIVLHYDKIKPAIKKIVQSHERGEHCLIRKELKGVKSQQFQGSAVNKRYPMLYSEADMSEGVREEMQRQEEAANKMKLYPPASASQMEFHILKFYCFSSALVYNVLKNLEMKIDFPFRVTDREHAVINLQARAPILLLGRSGTGKTTCCLYRLWSRFLTYWSKSKEMEYAPWLPRTVQYAIQDEEDGEEEEGGEEGDGEEGDDDDDFNEELLNSLLGSEEQKKAARGAAAAPSTSKAKQSKKEDSGVEDCKEEEEEEEEEEELLSSVQYDHLHQLFVTKNQVLCSEVQKNFRELCHADDVAKHHVETEETAMPHKLQDINEYKYPLFLTSRQLLLMLDASLEPAPGWPHFFDRNEDGSLRVNIQGWGGDEEIFAYVPLEDDSDEEGEEEFYEGEEGEGRDGDAQAAVDNRPKVKDSRREATYEVFAHEIWPKIIKKSQVNYHPSLVWTEIMSFIKGSFASLTQRKGYLDLEGYENLGRKQAPNFTGNRDKVYELFLRYNDYKRQHGLYDEADLVFNIFQRLRLGGPVPWVLHEVFVDETQDFTQAELTVLIRLAHNPNDMFLTGDTAQSIMRGVSFRFSDLKTLFHYAKQSLQARGKTGMLEVPRQVYQLTHNYRSHAGILSLASAVLDLLVEFFPESFDRLEKDQGLFDGPQPVVLESGSAADLAILLSGNKRKTSHIEFGAHQVILVVSEEARNSLPEELSLGLVLTIYEAKGLEFDDVLLYNFFTDSQASKEWRVVTDFLERQCQSDAAGTRSSISTGLVEIDEEVLHQTGRPRPLAFDPNQHKILNSELKHLYTAVTRARVNVWIFDHSADKRAPMFEYFKARKLVKFVSMREGSSGVSQSMFAEKSSPKEWEKRGDEIMQRSLYDVASKCYAMAGATHKQNIAIAHQKALKASHLRSQPRQMRDAFLKAAILFLECHNSLAPSAATLPLRFNLVMKAGRCLQNARENQLAAMVFEKNGQPELAGPLYLRARKWIQASQCFEHVDNFGRALKILDEQELYDQAIDCLQRYKIRRQDLERKNLPVPRALVDNKPEAAYTIASLSYKSATSYLRLGESHKHKMLAAIERLPNKEDQIKFLQKNGMLMDAAQLMREDGRISEAARMMLHNGKLDKALRIAEEGEDNSLKAQCYWLKAQQLLAEARKSQKASPKTDIAKVQEITGHSEEESAAALQECQGSVDQAVAFLSEGKQPQKKGGQSKGGKKKVGKDAESSDEEIFVDDDTKNKVKVLLEKARQHYDLCKDFTGLGECQLALAELSNNQELLETAFNSFKTTQPVSNTAGMLECVEALQKLFSHDGMTTKTCGKLTWGVENVFDVVRVLLQPNTPEDKNRYQVYLSFYGLEKSGEGKLVLHPKLKPRCVQMIHKEILFSKKEDKKEERLYQSATEVCNHLAEFLIQRAKAWCSEVEFHLQKQLPEVIQCHSFQEGVICEDNEEGMCPYLHELYTEELCRKAMEVLSCSVRLDHAFQSAVEQLVKVDIPLSELTLSLTNQEHMWNSVETLLDFIFPSGLMTYNMSVVLSFCSGQVNAGVFHQLQRYLQYLWDNPGRVGKGKSSNVLKERCKSTHWITLASLLVPIFKLNIQVDENCQQLERELMKKRPNWMVKRHKYALINDHNVVINMGRRHLKALEFFKPNGFDPWEALIWFTKFVKLLSDRGEVGLMPDLRIFLYWLEVFSTIALIMAAKIQGNGTVVLPSCYPRGLRLFNLTLPKSRPGDLMTLLNDFKLIRRHTMDYLHQRIKTLTALLCNGASFCLLSHLVNLPKKKLATHLLTERVLVLALTLLLNVEQGNVSAAMETPTLHCIHNIEPQKLDQMPPRLASLIDGVQGAASYADIISALNTSLSQVGERVQCYQWRFNPKYKDGLIPLDAARMRAGGPFRYYDPGQQQMYNTAGLPDVSDSNVDDIDEGTQLLLTAEEEEISAEEKEQALAGMEEERRKEAQSQAAQVLLSFLRNFILRKRLGMLPLHRLPMPRFSLRIWCVHQIEKELFSPFNITDKMCGVCGKRFEKEVAKSPSTESPLQGEATEVEAEEADDEEVVMATLKQAHVTSEKHRFMFREFSAFREIYQKSLSQPMLEIGTFLSTMEVKKRRNTWYKGMDFQVNGVLTKIETLQNQLDLNVQERKWSERTQLTTLRNDLVQFFQNHVRKAVQQAHDSQQVQEKQAKAAKEADRQHQEKMGEGLVDDQLLEEYQDVVDRPMHVGPNANIPAGRGAYRGRINRRGRGQRGRGNDTFVQFEEGDVPPRFRRQQQQ